MIPSTADRLVNLLDNLEIDRAHFCACMSADWGQFAVEHADRIQSLTVVMPHLNKGTPDGLEAVPFPTLVIAGDQGKPADLARLLAGRFRNATLAELKNYCTQIWSDTVAERTSDVATALIDFLNRTTADRSQAHADPEQREGEVDGITFRIEGAGPPLVLLPLSLAPSQWEPLVPRLSEDFCTITLRGPHLGIVELLESREKSGYGDLVAQVVQHASLRSGEKVLEAGCGSGALVRKLARVTNKSNAITGADLNRYLLSEAQFLAAKEGLEETIQFDEANCTALPYTDGQFDAVICCTVLEEGDANAMASEIARVTRKGGRAAVMTRAIDVDWWVNLPVPDELRAKLNSLGPKTGAGVGDDGCADTSLYKCLTSAGFMPRFMGPLFAIYKEGERLETVLDRLASMLAADEVPVYRDAIKKAADKGTLFVGEPFHSFVGTKMT